ncbi:iron-sulfur cluster biosynthesis family protein [Lacticaseibacillus zeae]|uniref:Iron-sulfur cluster biosynthesis family protein n=1 Tax=Lacticaseibacillus zeae TaxID=57037 RepID=A0A5R8LRB0_LACZE|nr:iron-sulfur cluster biosynthesis family protein [Lacticaseibacillus zeae]TLF39660.1 iron-sulfur cluster biosynthesis family protein [Lacticaseibacillus zeae]
MELNISAQAAARLAPLLHADRVLVLDLNDGIGPYSRQYHDTSQAKFSLLILPRRNVPDVFDAHLDSPVGPVLIKSYAAGFFDSKTELTINGDEFTLLQAKPHLNPKVPFKFV